ncbi:MAG: PilZ domain-containing protein [Candidatus Sulfotelmatobacter sp.]
MQLVSFPARQARTHYRHDLRTLTYVTLDAANGGIIRNLNREGVAVQAVAPLRQEQRVRLRFELRFPRLRVETYGQVTWAGPSGQCGIRFVELPSQTARQIDQWIFSNLLDGIEPKPDHGRSIFGALPLSMPPEKEDVVEQNDGLTISAACRPAIRVEPQYVARNEGMFPDRHREQNLAAEADPPNAQLNWLSRPISGQTVAWLVDSLVMIAGLLLFALIFLSITHELPPWPLAVGAISSGAVLVGAAYWGLFALFGGASLGARLAGSASVFKQEEEPDEARRFR